MNVSIVSLRAKLSGLCKT